MTTATCWGTWSAGIWGAAAFEVCWGGRANLPLLCAGSGGKTTGQLDLSGKVG
jgi:hypothetical protein